MSRAILYSDHSAVECICFLCLRVYLPALFLLASFHYLSSLFLVIFHFNSVFFRSISFFLICSFLSLYLFYSFLHLFISLSQFVCVSFFLSIPMVFTWRMNAVGGVVSPSCVTCISHDSRTQFDPHRPPPSRHFTLTPIPPFICVCCPYALHSFKLRGHCIIATAHSATNWSDIQTKVVI